MHVCKYICIYIFYHAISVLLTKGTPLLLIFKESSTYMGVFIKYRFWLKKSKQIFTVFCEQIVLGLVTNQTMGTTNLWFYTWDELGPAVSLIEKSKCSSLITIKCSAASPLSKAAIKLMIKSPSIIWHNRNKSHAI